MPATDEVRVRFAAALRGARLADPDAPLEPAAPARAPSEPAAPARALESPLLAPRPPEPPTPDVSLWETEIGRRLDEDRVRIDRALAAVAQRVRELHEARRQERQEWRGAAIELGVTLAARLLHDRILAGDFPVETLVREMIEEVTARPDARPDAGVVVYLNPEDLALLRQRLERAAHEASGLEQRREGVSYTADPALGRGDCRVEAGDALVLAQLDVQLAEMRRRLLRSLGHAQV